MRQRPLPPAPAVAVAALGLGDISLPRAAARGVDVLDVSRSVHAAIEAGLHLLEVADDSDSERLVGDAIRTLRARDRAIVACRVTALAGRAGAPARDVLPERLPARHVQARVEDALRATRLEVLPLVQLPVRAAWRSSAAWPELRGTCARLVREGKVLRWGALADPVEDDTAELASEDWLASLAVPYSACERAAEPVIAAALERKLAVLARRPLAGGALAGKLGPGAALRATDDRRGLPLERIAVGAARLAPLVKREPPAARSCDAAREALEAGRRPAELACETLAEIALRFVIDRGAIALPRLHHPAHLSESLTAAAAAPLPASTLEQLDAALADLRVS